MINLPTGKIEIRLLSEAIFASGEKESHIVHSRALTDRDGFVYFHAKSLKGQLKRQAFWLLEQYRSFDLEKAKAFLHSIERLFGLNGNERSIHWPGSEERYSSQGTMRLGALELPAAVKSYFLKMMKDDEADEYYTLSTHDLIAAQTHIRSRIEVKNGTAKDKSLTTYHTVREDLVFYATVSFESRPHAEDLENLNRIVCSLERIGAGIHRGHGEVEARLFLSGVEE
ncbi:hypothetical protein N0M98_13595 [Paenibacillus doosanensis]|uniref:RAMP superfamily CRISPR-associated protein n=1 Tax=Paenibacillus doosanensis TaxID=1229154 RepID=UPI00217F82AF|nr:RAMP superfamily CRISPR-associated protein [Paenibacillus doosanensis]MCS7461182.1 hypothetical protein [Paenibacillus doosanensis]